jgi:hypothetical protein
MHSCWMMRETEFPQLTTENEMFFLFGLGNEKRRMKKRGRTRQDAHADRSLLDSRLNSTHNFCLVSPPSKRYTHTARRERHGANCMSDAFRPSGGGAINKMNNNLYCHLAVVLETRLKLSKCQMGKCGIFKGVLFRFGFVVSFGTSFGGNITQMKNTRMIKIKIN